MVYIVIHKVSLHIGPELIDLSISEHRTRHRNVQSSGLTFPSEKFEVNVNKYIIYFTTHIEILNSNEWRTKVKTRLVSEHRTYHRYLNAQISHHQFSTSSLYSEMFTLFHQQFYTEHIKTLLYHMRRSIF